jgi:hypothetical protein
MSAVCEFDGEIGEVLCRGDHIGVETLIKKEKSQRREIIFRLSFAWVNAHLGS